MMSSLFAAPASVARQIDAVSFVNISATPAPFVLHGGNYGVTIHATFSGGSVTLQRLATDGVTFVNVITPLTADGYVSADLPSGTYRLAITTATAVFCDITATVTTQ
jgi:hypothetical protein